MLGRSEHWATATLHVGAVLPPALPLPTVLRALRLAVTPPRPPSTVLTTAKLIVLIPPVLARHVLTATYQVAGVGLPALPLPTFLRAVLPAVPPPALPGATLVPVQVFAVVPPARCRPELAA